MSSNETADSEPAST